MSAADATKGNAPDGRIAYELAYHVLPTVAEGEVPAASAAIVELITQHDGEVYAQEEPRRIELSYDIEKRIEGTIRRFHSAYFGWVRFRAPRTQSDALDTALRAHDAPLLRTLRIALTPAEQAHPFYYHPAQEALRAPQGDVEGERHAASEPQPEAADTDTDAVAPAAASANTDTSRVPQAVTSSV